jgi:hypothetical protein
MNRIWKSALAFITLSAIPTIASPVTISASGTWGALTGSDAYFASGQPWTLSIQLANPSVPNFSSPTFFTETYTTASTL